jgi:hypothetical protein
VRRFALMTVPEVISDEKVTMVMTKSDVTHTTCSCVKSVSKLGLMTGPEVILMEKVTMVMAKGGDTTHTTCS